MNDRLSHEQERSVTSVEAPAARAVTGDQFLQIANALKLSVHWSEDGRAVVSGARRAPLMAAPGETLPSLAVRVIEVLDEQACYAAFVPQADYDKLADDNLSLKRQIRAVEGRLAAAKLALRELAEATSTRSAA